MLLVSHKLIGSARLNERLTSAIDTFVSRARAKDGASALMSTDHGTRRHHESSIESCQGSEQGRVR